MKRFSVICIFAILFSAHLGVQAQTPEPLPSTLPDPAEIFNEDVQWSLVEPPAPVVRSVRIDDERQVIQVTDINTDTQREYPFPPDVSSIYSAVKRPDGLIVVRLNWEFGSDPQPSDVLLLDPNTGLYEPAPTVCNGQVLQAEPGQGAWTIAYLDADYERPVLCNSEDGDQRDVLPSGRTDWWISPSPNGNWLILAGDNSQVYAYSINDDQVIPLGAVSDGIADHAASVWDWVSDVQGLLCRPNDDRTWPGASCFSFDVTQPNSIEYAFSDLRGGNVFRLDNPVRYGSVLSEDYSALITGSQNPNHPPCTLTLYDAAGLRQHELGYECIPIILNREGRSPYYRQGNMLYYLTFDSPDSTVSTLRSYDIEFEAGNNALFYGEIENILSVSPDNRYVVLLLDDNGMLESRWMGPCCFEIQGWQIAILEAATSQIVYHSEPVGVYTADQAIWLDDTTLIISAAQEYELLRATEDGSVLSNRIPASLRRINLDNGVNVSMIMGSTDHHWPDLNWLSPGEWHYLLSEDNTVLDLRTYEPVPILRNDIPEKYTVRLTWSRNGELEVHVSVGDNSSVTIYRVRLD